MRCGQEGSIHTKKDWEHGGAASAVNQGPKPKPNPLSCQPPTIKEKGGKAELGNKTKQRQNAAALLAM